MIFSHGGAMGDIVYHLAVIRKLGGGEFYIIPADRNGYRTRTDMQYTNLSPLIESQPYITKVGWSDVPVGICFDAWRHRLDFGKNLTDQAAQWLGMAPLDPLEPWLEGIEPNPIAPVVFSRSHQINFFHEFDWPMLVRHYQGKAVFLGHSHEHSAFCTGYGHVPFHPTPSYLEAARVIAGCKLFIGNPAGLLAVAEGLKVQTIIASAPHINHCVYFNRPNVQHCWATVEPMSID